MGIKPSLRQFLLVSNPVQGKGSDVLDSQDQVRFEMLVLPHLDAAFNLARWLLRSGADAEDAAQEAMLRSYRFFHGFRGGDVRAWLLHIVRNTCCKKSLQAVSIEGTPGPDKETGSPSIDIGAPDLLMEGLIDRINLERRIKQLPVSYRTIFVLHDVQGYTHREIARILGCSVGASKSQLHKARTRLRELLHELQRGKARDWRFAAAKMRSGSSATLLP